MKCSKSAKSTISYLKKYGVKDHDIKNILKIAKNLASKKGKGVISTLILGCACESYAESKEMSDINRDRFPLEALEMALISTMPDMAL